MLSSTRLSWRMGTPVHQHKPTGIKSKRHFHSPTGLGVSLSGSVKGRGKARYLGFDRTARKDLDFRKSQIVLLELWPDPLQRSLHELEAGREREMPNSLALSFPRETKLWRPHRLALPESTLLSMTHPHAGLLHIYKSSFCGSHGQNSPLLSEPTGLRVLCECVGYTDT